MKKQILFNLPMLCACCVLLLSGCSVENGNEKDPSPATRAADDQVIGGLADPFTQGMDYELWITYSGVVQYPRLTQWVFSENLNASVSEMYSPELPQPWWENRGVTVRFDIEAPYVEGTLTCTTYSQSIVETPYTEVHPIRVGRDTAAVVPPPPTIPGDAAYQPVVTAPGHTIRQGTSAAFSANVIPQEEPVALPADFAFVWEVIQQGSVQFTIASRPGGYVFLQFPLAGVTTVKCSAAKVGGVDDPWYYYQGNTESVTFTVEPE
ncbi:MAG: hypothetical protein LUE10_03060 [Alistipes sp.]|nr:hypothetical protein [Alistipes sp.]